MSPVIGEEIGIIVEKLSSGWRRHIQVATPAVAAAAVTAWAVSLSACSSPAITAKTLQATTTPAQSASAIARRGMRTYYLTDCNLPPTKK